MGIKIAGIEIKHLTHDSRSVIPGSCFFVLSGSKSNGEMFIRQAVSKGAALIVRERVKEKEEQIYTEKESVPELYVENVRAFMSLAAKRFNNNICDKMDIIAVVGTNGKTTCTYMLRHILGKTAAVIGTLGPSKLTTPDPIELHEIFAGMYARGVRTVIMEVSAHAIYYCKVTGINFKSAIYTNLTQDHLDFFKTFESYAKTKLSFFGDNVQLAVINTDDEYGRRIIKSAKCDIQTYSLEDIKDLKLTSQGSEFCLNGNKITVNIPGRFNVYNALACIYTARELGISFGRIIKALKNLPVVPGRFNVFTAKTADGKFSVIVDYAHTPDSIEKILNSARELMQDRGHLIAVFGCGGDRDKTKREIMGAVAARLSDSIVVTSDNPRNESPMAIMLQIQAGIKTVEFEKQKSINFCLIENRTEAINYALNIACENDVVVIAGRGGEVYQEILGRKIELRDEEIVKQYIQKSENTHNKKTLFRVQ